MTAPQCGTYAGTVAHWKAGTKPCEPCSEAGYKYGKRRKYEAAHGQRRLVSNTGYIRRVHALQALGYPFSRIAKMLGCSHSALCNRVYRGHHVSRRNLAQLAELCERIGYQPCPDPDTRSLKYAARMGWVPMAAWDDIDHDDEPARTVAEASSSIDEVAVQRLISGDYSVALNHAERRLACQLWAESGRTLADLERLTGWRTNRYYKKGAAA